VTPAEHAATVRGALADCQDVLSAPDVDRAMSALDALVALAERATELEARWQEIEHPFDKSEYDAMFARMEAAEARVAELETALKLLEERRQREVMAVTRNTEEAQERMRRELVRVDARATELEQRLQTTLDMSDRATETAWAEDYHRLTERAERAEAALAEEREEHSATREEANGWRESRDLERGARERAETALREQGEPIMDARLGERLLRHALSNQEACDLIDAIESREARARAALGETAP
jgi:hypothetical protein